MIPHLSLSWWIAGTACVVVLWIFESSFRVTRTLKRRIEELEELASPHLEIVFDKNNPYQRFWKKTQAKDKDGMVLPIVGWEYRIGIHNRSKKTVRNVRVSVEVLGEKPVDPKDVGFQKDSKDCRDISPYHTELVPIAWILPPRPGDAAGNLATAYHGPIRVIARGDDIVPSETLFDYRPLEMPVLVERHQT